MSVKVVHWCDKTLNSGLGHTAKNICEAEKQLGLNSLLVDGYDESDWHNADDADIHVVHLFMPPKVVYKTRAPLVWVAHGTPNLMFESGYTESIKGQYGASDGWMIAQWCMQNADAIVTFWPRHEAIWKSLCDKHTRVEGVPLGVPLEYWGTGKTNGKFAGEPSVLSAENCYTLKWPLSLCFAWPWIVREGFPDAKLHLVNMPLDQSRVWFPLINRNGSGFHTYLTNRSFNHEELRNAFLSTDYYCGLVRYGDMNYISLQANAAGVKTISHKGNPYSTYWVDEGDERILAQQLLAIFRGEVEARQQELVPSIHRTAERFQEIYLSLAKDGPTGIAERKPRVRKAKLDEKIIGPPLTTLAVQ